MTTENHQEQSARRRKLLSTLCGVTLTSAAGCISAAKKKAKGFQNEDSDSSNTTDESGISRVGLGADTFERLSDLEVIDGQLSADTERQVSGTQCAALETGADGAWLNIPLDEPMDFSAARPACHVAIDGTAAGKNLYLDLCDTDGNRFRTRTAIRSHGELVQVDFGILEPQVDGTAVDLENITKISFRPGPTGKSGTEVVYLDHPRRIAAPDTAKVVFQFDDGNKTDYTEGLSSLSRYGYPAITYVNTDTIGNPGRLDEDQLQELHDEGWLIGSHTTDHTDLSSLSDPSEIEQRVRDAKQWLVERGFTEGARHFAYPYNATNEQVLSIVSRFHDSGRVSSWQPIAQPSNPQLIPGIGEPTVTEMRTLLDQATQYGGVVSVYYHNLSKSKDIEKFHKVVDEVRKRERAGEVDVIRLDELISLANKSTSR